MWTSELSSSFAPPPRVRVARVAPKSDRAPPPFRRGDALQGVEATADLGEVLLLLQQLLAVLLDVAIDRYAGRVRAALSIHRGTRATWRVGVAA